jgi:hypothetical protein
MSLFIEPEMGRERTGVASKGALDRARRVFTAAKLSWPHSGHLSRRIPLALPIGGVPVAGSQRCWSFAALWRCEATRMLGDLPTFFVVIIAVAAFLAGLCPRVFSSG